MSMHEHTMRKLCAHLKFVQGRKLKIVCIKSADAHFMHTLCVDNLHT